MPLSIKCEPGTEPLIPLGRRILSRAKEMRNTLSIIGTIFRHVTDPTTGVEIKVYSTDTGVLDFDKIIITGGRLWNYLVKVPGKVMLFHTKKGKVASAGTDFVYDGNFGSPVTQMVWGGKELNGIVMTQKGGKAAIYDIDSQPKMGITPVPSYPASAFNDAYYILGRGRKGGIAARLPIPMSSNFNLRLGSQTIEGTTQASDSIRSYGKNYFQPYGGVSLPLKTVGFKDKVPTTFLSQGASGTYPAIALSRFEAYQEIRAPNSALSTIYKLFGGGSFDITAPDPVAGFGEPTGGLSSDYIVPSSAVLVNANPIGGVAISPVTRETNTGTIPEESFTYSEKVVQADFYWVDDTGVNLTYTMGPFGGFTGFAAGETWTQRTTFEGITSLFSAFRAYELMYFATEIKHNAAVFSTDQLVQIIDVTEGSAVDISGEAAFLAGADPYTDFPLNVTVIDVSLPDMGIFVVRNITSGDIKFYFSDGTIIFIASDATRFDERATKEVAYVLISVGGTIFLVGSDLSVLDVSAAIAAIPNFGGTIGAPQLVNLKDEIRVVSWANRTTGNYAVFEINQAGATTLYSVGTSEPSVFVPFETRDSQQDRLVEWVI